MHVLPKDPLSHWDGTALSEVRLPPGDLGSFLPTKSEPPTKPRGLSPKLRSRNLS